MNRDMIEKINFIEKELDIKFPNLYKKFLIEEIQNYSPYEIVNENGANIYLYCYTDIFERNKTYKIQEDAPNYFLIGQDGDLGYFVYVKKGSETDTIYNLDLGALGSLSMEKIANNLYDLGIKSMPSY